MALTKEQADEIKKQLLVQVDKLPQENKEEIKQQILGLNEEQLEEFLKQNKVSVVKEKKSLVKSLFLRNTSSETPKKVVLEVIPEEKDPMAQKIEMAVDMERGVITNQKMFSNYGTTKIDMEYENIKGAWVIKRINMTVPTPMGKTGKMTIDYTNIKLNQGINDKLFEE